MRSDVTKAHICLTAAFTFAIAFFTACAAMPL